MFKGLLCRILGYRMLRAGQTMVAGLVKFPREVWESLKESLWALVLFSIWNLWFWSAEVEESAVVKNSAASLK